MKKHILIATALLSILIGCDKKGTVPEQETPAICGEWKGEDLPVDVTIYIAFNTDMSFELYQHMKMDRYDLYKGVWETADNIISGRYNDGEAWAYSYEFEIKDGFLKLRPVGEEEQGYIFTACEIPDIIKEKADLPYAY